MLKNNIPNPDRHVEFVSYTGKYPNLCSGVLTLRIDGKEYTFGTIYRDKTDFPKFWQSGGSCVCGWTQKGEWVVDTDFLPEKLYPYAREIDEVFNQNVEHGCCGGCR